MKNNQYGFKSAAAMAIFCLLHSTSALANDEAGTIKTLKGNVSIERKAQKIDALVGGKVLVNDRLLTGPDSALGVTLLDNTLLSAGPNSTLEVKRFSFDSTNNTGEIDATLKRGTLAVVSGKIAKNSPDKVHFRSATVSLGIRGTEFILDAGAGKEEK